MIDEAKTGEEKTKQPIARRLPLNLSVNLNNKFHLGVKSLRRIFLFCFLSLSLSTDDCRCHLLFVRRRDQLVFIDVRSNLKATLI